MTTKVCPKCGNDCMIELKGSNEKICSNGACATVIPWPLEEGQQATFGKHRSKPPQDQ